MLTFFRFLWSAFSAWLTALQEWRKTQIRSLAGESWSTISGANVNNGVFIFPAPIQGKKGPHSREMLITIPKGKWPAIVIVLFPKNKPYTLFHYTTPTTKNFIILIPVLLYV